jgi:hypothetical protein
MMPEWWNSERRDECLECATKNEVYNIRLAVEKADIQEKPFASVIYSTNRTSAFRLVRMPGKPRHHLLRPARRFEHEQCLMVCWKTRWSCVIANLVVYPAMSS